MKAWRLVGLVLLVWAASLPAAHGGSGDSLANPLGFVFDAPVEGAIEFLKPHKSGTPSSEVTDWNTFASNLVAANLPPGPQTYTLAVVHIAIHDALNSIDPRYEPYDFAGFVPGASVAAAVAARGATPCTEKHLSMRLWSHQARTICRWYGDGRARALAAAGSVARRRPTWPSRPHCYGVFVPAASPSGRGIAV